MEPIALAGLAVRVMLPILSKAKDQLADTAAARLADGLTGAVGKLFALVSGKLSADPFDAAIVAGVQAKPDNAIRVQALEQRLTELIADDPAFAAALRQALAEVPDNEIGPTVRAVNSGVTAGGSIAQRAGGDVVGRDKSTQG